MKAVLAALSTTFWAITFWAITFWAASAAAWNPISPSRPVWCEPAPYALNNAGSADLGFMQTEAEVRRAMDDWTRRSCSGLRTTYRGTVTNRPGSYEGVSTIGWSESSWGDDPRAIGVTGPSWNGRSCIVEADMVLNGVNYTWTTSSGSGSRVNAYSILAHEGGHYFGLGHSGDRAAIMFASYAGGIAAIDSDDEAGICALYPGSGVDCTTTGCPTGQECVDGVCEAIVGDGTVCSPCTENGQCGASDDFCIGYPDGGSYCGSNCRSDADCVAFGAVCAELRGGGSQCARQDGPTFSCSVTPPPGCTSDASCGPTERCNTTTRACEPRPTDRAGVGEPCDSNEGCNSGFCIATPTGGVCTQTCDWLDVGSCPSGFYCNGNATGSCGDGVCLAGTAGATPDGGACTEPTECASLHCLSGVCGSPCVPGVADTCQEGTTCRMGTQPGCGICRGAAALGQPCEDNLDCASRFCASEGDVSYCTDLCSADEPCPSGFACLPAGELHVCAPPVGRDAGGRRGGCGCEAGGSEGPLTWALLAPLVLAVLRRRRR